MIVGYVVGQALTIDTPVIASDSVNYIEARFVFLNRDWDGLAIHAIFDDGDVAYACPLKDGRVAQDNGLNLGAGTWRVHLVGSAMDGDVLVRRITTNPAKIEVVCAGRMDGEPVPPARYTDIEEIEAALTKKIDAPQKTTKECGESETITLADNAEYRLTNVTALTFAYPENDFECWIRLTISKSGDVAVVLPEGTKYIGPAPTFANDEMWEISIKDGVVIAQKVGDGT